MRENTQNTQSTIDPPITKNSAVDDFNSSFNYLAQSVQNMNDLAQVISGESIPPSTVDNEVFSSISQTLFDCPSLMREMASRLDKIRESMVESLRIV